MSRDFKFRYRLKDKADNSEITVYALLNSKQNGTMQFPIELDIWEVLSIDEFTGLIDKSKDKNDIYENDFVKTRDGIMRVVYLCDGFQCIGADGNNHDLYDYIYRGFIKVVGDIYKNPELISEM